ncbi:MAG TPA: adenylate/guanylate cyclase domain-containing protein [Bauldia sp.]|nr:adenylate/guanylate cyclase domain-containing protein [Bauldia sp.]
MARAQRKLTVLASLDVAGYTLHMERNERATLMALARIRMRILRPTLDEYGGSMFKTMGDGALIEFPNVEDSIRWAIAFQTAMAERNAGRGEDAIQVRLGIGLADVFVSGEDRFGAAVGFVVRLQQAAPTGGIAITHSVRWQLAKPLAAEFDRTEWVEFKNMDEQFEIWLWRGVGKKAGAAPTGQVVGLGHRPLGMVSDTTRIAPSGQSPIVVAANSNGGRPSIAVLAFDNMSGDPSADSIADGVVEEITATLSRVREFKVVARNSAYAYKGRAADIRDIARELGVRYVLEGSLRKSHDRVRVTAQLIDADSGSHLWADSYDGQVDNLFDFEDEIAEQVAGAVNPSIQQAEIALAKRKRPESLAAYDLVLRALPHLWAHRREDNAEAIRLLDEARKLDPGYARATAVAAWARAQHVIYQWTDEVEKTREESRALIEDAAEKVGDDPTALTALATATTLLLGDLDRAGHFIERALVLDPNNAWAWSRRGFMQAYAGHGEEAIAAFEHALRLSPLDPFSFNSHNGIGFANFVLGRYDQAIEWTLRGMREKSGMTWAHRDLAAYYALAGRSEDAHRSIAELIKTRPHLTIAKVGEALRFVEPSVLARYLGGLRIAGLAE